MKFTELEKNMIVIALRNEGKKFQEFADELEQHLHCLSGETLQFAKERMIEYLDVAQGYEELMMKVSIEMEAEQ